jgi:flagellar biosynthesis/type III secretory pathway protein FliH
MKSEVTSFLSHLPSATRPLGEVLPSQASAPVLSPWSPQPSVVLVTDDGAVRAELASARAELANARVAAVADGRREGLAETEALRAKLSTLMHSLAEERRLAAATHAELVADAALTVVEAWLDRDLGDQRSRFTPLVRGWLERTGDGADTTAWAHPDDLDALRAAIGDAAITLEADATMTRGDLRLRGRGLDLEHRWVDRLRELRHELATVLAPTLASDPIDAEAQP